MISIDNTKKPFIKSAKAKRAGKFRRGGVKGYRVPSSHVYLEGSGSGDAGMKIWKPVMQKYFKQIPKTSFHQPPRRIQVGKQVRVPYIYGMSISAATKKLEKAGFTVDKQYVYSNSVRKYGFIGWSPGPGSTISEFGSVYGMYSKGRDPAVVAREKADAKKKSQQKKKKSPPQPPQFPPFPPGPR
jgi:hypothetical protein